MKCFVAVLALLVYSVGAFGQGVAPGMPGAASLPSAAEIKELVDKGQYREALKPLIRVLELKGDAAAGYDRYEMLMLRGECQLQIRELVAAKDSFAAARKAAEAKTDSPAEAAAVAEGAAPAKAVAVGKAAAMELLLARSTAFAYKSKSTDKDAPKEAISILDLNKRPRVMVLLFNDEMGTIQSKYDAAMKSKSLVPIMDFAKTAAAIRSLELTVEGNNSKTTAMFSGLAKHAATLMEAEADAMKIRVESIKRTADELVTETINVVDASGRGFPQTRIRKKGMTDADKTAVRAIGETCKKFSPAGKELTTALGADATTFDTANKKALDVSVTCESLLLTDYGVPVR